MTLSSFVALCSGILQKPLQCQLVVLGDMSLGGNIIPVENLAESLQVAFDAGAKRILLPMASVGDIPTIPGELFAKFQTRSMRIRWMRCLRRWGWSKVRLSQVRIFLRQPPLFLKLTGFRQLGI